MIRANVVAKAFYCETHRINGGYIQNRRLTKAALRKVLVLASGHILYGVCRDEMGRLSTYFIWVNDEELSMLASLAMSVPQMIIHAMHA